MSPRDPYTNPGPKAAFKGFKPGGGFEKGHRPRECGAPATGYRSKFRMLEYRERQNCPSCYRAATRPGRALCGACRQRSDRYGDPQARGNLPVRKVLGYTIAEAWRLIRYIDTLPKNNQARRLLVQARLWLGNQLTSSRPYALMPYRHGRRFNQTVYRRLAQLDRHGVPVDQLLATVAGFMWARDNLPAMILSDQHFKHQLGRHVLSFISIPHLYRRCSESVPATAARWWGEKMHEHLATFCGAIARPGHAGIPTLPDTPEPPRPGMKRSPGLWSRQINKKDLKEALYQPMYRPLEY